jgi:tetratricopeptide (TPR) repeat protein
MRSIYFKIIAATVVVATFFTGCDLKKMTKKYDTVKYETTPTVLETKGGKIAVSVKGTIPAKYFGKQAIVEFAPVLKYANGTTQLKSITIQGEKVKGNGTSIKKKAGGSFTYSDVIDYKPDMNVSNLVVNAKVSIKKKSKELGERKLADGVIYTSERIQSEGDPILAPDGYVKEVIVPKSSEIFFAKGLSDLNLQYLPLNKDQENAKKLKDFVDFMKKSWKIKNIDISAWASPEGEETTNQGLSDKRSKTAETYLKDQLKDIAKNIAKEKKQKYDEKQVESTLPTSTLAPKGEDWDGFLKTIGASSVKDKEKVLNVVNSESDPLKKEKAINDMTVIYPEIEAAILPPLRRALITINYFEPRRTDQEIAQLAVTTPDSLKKEELLYAATLTEDLNTKLKIYESATKVYANEWKGYNNAGYVCIKLGKVDEASTYLEKANTLSPNTGMIVNNLGVAAEFKKDFDKAKSYYETAKGLGIDEGFNMGPVLIKQGDYAGAVTSYGSRTCTHNIALAQLMAGNTSAAASTLDCTNPKTAAVYYMMAVVGARTSNTTMIYENLPKAITLDASYRDQAKDDREFLKWNTGADFLNAIK